ncbi:hypothetical protein L1987_34293 [Smallanthus sonchifolius]|uniref:Uncharacterized protein n=1 Tax=Smallanthus sonchifolius TaxID=185202 RepID=A0ACB9HTE0_9ASTR|nr:hypothetical protein L1987_34293 [Smallanthus sonchifolius]
MCDGGPLESLACASFNLHRSLAEELDGSLSYGYRPLTAVTVSIDESQPPSKSPILPPWWSVAAEEEGVVVKVDRGGVIGGDAVVLALGPWSSKLPELSSRFRVYAPTVRCFFRRFVMAARGVNEVGQKLIQHQQYFKKWKMCIEHQVFEKGFKAQGQKEITKACPNLKELSMACMFDPRYIAFVGDETLASIVVNFPKLSLLHLADPSALQNARYDPESQCLKLGNFHGTSLTHKI